MAERSLPATPEAPADAARWVADSLDGPLPHLADKAAKAARVLVEMALRTAPEDGSIDLVVGAEDGMATVEVASASLSQLDDAPGWAELSALCTDVDVDRHNGRRVAKVFIGEQESAT